MMFTPRAPRRRRAALALVIPALAALLAFSLLASGCGKKAWPTPQDTEHAFSFTDMRGEMQGGCLVVTGRVQGAWQDMETVYLEYGANECPGCPFVPERSVEYARGDENFSLDGGLVRITRCGLDAGAAYRWRLTGVNVLGAVDDVQTGVMSTD